jgi:outer membrane lipoprotein-sorting protein
VTGRSKTPETALYGDVIKWVRKDNWVPIRVDFYDKTGKLLKRSTVVSLENVAGNWTPMKVEMHNVQTDHKTVMVVNNVEYDTQIAANTFEKSNLERAR